MKNILFTNIFLFLLLLLLGCAEDDDCTALTMEKVYPNNNAADQPVLIKGEGFGSNTKVRFGSQKADIIEVNENYISTKVPKGLLGLVEVSLENGADCIATKDFEVIPVSNLPANLPASPPVYIIPNAAFAFPPQVGTRASIILTNIWDNNHEIELFPSEAIVVDYEEGTSERLNGFEYPISGSHNLTQNKVSINIDRSSSGLPEEKLEGSFYNLSLQVNGQTVTGNFLVAFSTITGRQYVFKSNG